MTKELWRGDGQRRLPKPAAELVFFVEGLFSDFRLHNPCFEKPKWAEFRQGFGLPGRLELGFSLGFNRSRA